MSNVPSVWPRRLGIAAILSGVAWLAFSALRVNPIPDRALPPPPLTVVIWP